MVVVMQIYERYLYSHAEAFAREAHGYIDQRRKYTNEPYITHPAAVASLVSYVEHTPEMVAAAWLHDVVEDTGIPLAMIRAEFGLEVAALVEMLTDVSKPEDGNRSERKRIDLLHTAKASPAAKTIKLADLIDNTSSIVKHDPEFAKVYLQEKLFLLEVLREGDNLLYHMALESCIRGLRAIDSQNIVFPVSIFGNRNPITGEVKDLLRGEFESPFGFDDMTLQRGLSAAIGVAPTIFGNILREQPTDKGGKA